MTHDEIRELLPAYLDGDVDDPGAVDAHLVSCEACSAVLASYKVMLAELAALPAGDPASPPGLVARAIAQIPERSTVGRIRGAAREHPVAVVAGVGGAAVAVIAAVYAIKRSRHATPVAARATA